MKIKRGRGCVKSGNKMTLSSPDMHDGFSFENEDSETDLIRSDSVVEIEWENYLKRHQESLFAENSIEDNGELDKKRSLQKPTRPTCPPKSNNKKEYSASHRIYKLPRPHKVFEKMVDKFDFDVGEVEQKEKEGPVSPLSSPDGSPDKESLARAQALSRRLSTGLYSTDGRKLPISLTPPLATVTEPQPSPPPRRPTSAVSVYSASSKKSSRSSSSRHSKSSAIDPDVECAQYMRPPEVPRTSADDWANSPAMQLALNGEDDNFASDLSDVITNVCTPVSSYLTLQCRHLTLTYLA